MSDIPASLYRKGRNRLILGKFRCRHHRLVSFLRNCGWHTLGRECDHAVSGTRLVIDQTYIQAFFRKVILPVSIDPARS